VKYARNKGSTTVVLNAFLVGKPDESVSVKSVGRALDLSKAKWYPLGPPHRSHLCIQSQRPSHSELGGSVLLRLMPAFGIWGFSWNGCPAPTPQVTTTSKRNGLFARRLPT